MKAREADALGGSCFHGECRWQFSSVEEEVTDKSKAGWGGP